MRTPSWKTVLTVVLVLFGAFHLNKRRSRAKELARLAAVDTETFIVRTEKAAVRDIEEKLVLSGSIKALEEAVLYPRVAGKLRKNLLFEGQAVARDQAVALIERDEVGVNFEPAPVPSTINGVVGRTYLDPGSSVTPQTPVALVVNQSQVRIKVDLPERYLGRVSVGQTGHVAVDAYPAASSTARSTRSARSRLRQPERAHRGPFQDNPDMRPSPACSPGRDRCRQAANALSVSRMPFSPRATAEVVPRRGRQPGPACERASRPRSSRRSSWIKKGEKSSTSGSTG